MKIRFAIAFFLLTTSVSLLYSQDSPVSCDHVVPPFANDRGEVIAKSKVAKEYYLTSPASDDVGHTFDQRTANLRTKIASYFAAYISDRTEKYNLTRCTFHKVKTATSQSGRVRKSESIVIDNSFEFIPSTLEHTTNGDMKGGPNINGKSIDWVTGTNSGRAKTFVRISVRYTQEYIKSSLDSEIAAMKLELNNLGIPTE